MKVINIVKLVSVITVAVGSGLYGTRIGQKLCEERDNLRFQNESLKYQMNKLYENDQYS